MSSRTMRTLLSLLLLAFLAVAGGCGGGSSPEGEGVATADREGTDVGAMVRPDGVEGSSATPEEDVEPGAEAGEAGHDRARVIFLGTSLTEGFGLEAPDSQAWPHRIEELARDAGIQGLEMVNAGLAGETSAAGARRISWILRAEPDLLIVELGANDGLRGIPVEEMERNLTRLLDEVAADAPGTAVALVRMEAPPNMGESYTAEFREAFERVVRDREVVLLPFILDGVAGDPALNLPDGIHPTAEGHALMAANVWDALRPLLEEVASTQAGSGTPP